MGIIISAAVFNIIGFIWYSDAFFGKTWKKESRMTREQISKSSSNMNRMIIFMALGSLIMAFIMSLVFNGFQINSIMMGLTTAFWLWLGFVATVMFHGVVYEMKSWEYYRINVSFQLVGMLSMGAILVLLK